VEFRLIVAVKTTTLAASLAVLIGVLATEAGAYTFSLTDTVPWTAPDGRTMTIGMLYGEGIIFADPARPVVLDEQGRVVAVGPLAHDGIVRCPHSANCRVLLGLSRGPASVEPDPGTFDPFRGRPDPMEGFYVTGGEQLELGFRPVESTWSDEWFRWTAAYRRSPIISLIFTVIFAALARGSARPLLMSGPLSNRSLLKDERWRTQRMIMAFLLAMFMSIAQTCLIIFLMAAHVFYGGSELTLLPCFLGWALGFLSVLIDFRWRRRGVRVQSC
jgi:hypothetical protein